MLRNSDGTPYQLTASFQQFNPNSPDHALFDLWDQEAIKQGGSPIYYYEVLLQTQTIDPIFGEDRGKLFCNTPIQLWCFYEPIRSQNLFDQMGIDSPDEMKFNFNYHAVLQALDNKLPKIGSRLYTPHLRENWVIIQNNLGDFKEWGILRLEIVCGRFQETLTTNEGKVTQKQPNIKID